MLQTVASTPRSQEIQNRPGVDVERIDPAILALIHFLFTCQQFEGMEFLALLCRQATEKQFAMFEQNVAVITFHGLTTLCKDPHWKWGYHATLRYFIIFEALGILTRLRRNKTTEVRIPLGVRKEPRNREQLLQSLNDLQTKKHAYKDKKLVQLIDRVRNQIKVYGLGDPGDSKNQQRMFIDQARFISLQERIISVMRTERIPVAKCKRITQWLCSDQIPELLQEYISTNLVVEGHVAEQQDNAQFHEQERTRRYQCSLGDSEALSPREDAHSNGDSQIKVGDSKDSLFAPQSKHLPEFATQKRPQKAQTHTNSTASTLNERTASPIIASSGGHENDMGDSKGCLSSNISLLRDHFSDKDRNDIEKTPEERSSESPRSEKSLLREATWIAIRLDGKESLKKNRGRGWVGAYKNKLLEHPYLVRCAMIDMFLQKSFPDWQGPPEKKGGPWFNKVYKAYALREEPVPPDIESWARSPYHYKQIEKALWRERERQIDEIADLRRHDPFYAEAFVRPFVDCVATYGLLDDEHVSLPFMLFEEDASVPEKILAEQFDVSATDNRQERFVEMGDESCFTQEENELLARTLEEEEEERRIDVLLSDPSLNAGDMLGAYLEQLVTMKLSTLPAPILDDVQQLQAILDPQCYTVEVLFTVAMAYVIRVQANMNPGNACLLEGPEQTKAFIYWFSHFPPTLLNDVEQLRAIVDPELYVVEILLSGSCPYVINIQEIKSSFNTCRLENTHQVREFIHWFQQMPVAVMDDMQLLRATLNSQVYSTAVILAVAESYTICIWANDDPTDFCLLEGPEQTQEVMAHFTQREVEDVEQGVLEGEM